MKILEDSGSTHNFLNPLEVQAAKLRIENDYSFQVRVANGDNVLSKGRCE